VGPERATLIRSQAKSAGFTGPSVGGPMSSMASSSSRVPAATASTSCRLGCQASFMLLGAPAEQKRRTRQLRRASIRPCAAKGRMHLQRTRPCNGAMQVQIEQRVTLQGALRPCSPEKVLCGARTFIQRASSGPRTCGIAQLQRQHRLAAQATLRLAHAPHGHAAVAAGRRKPVHVIALKPVTLRHMHV